MAKDPFKNRKRNNPPQSSGSGAAETETEVDVKITTKKKRRINRADSKDFTAIGARISNEAKEALEDFVPKCKRKDGYQTQDEVIEAALLAFIKQRKEAWEAGAE